MWLPRGSRYWEQKWLTSEKSSTNRWYLQGYLKRAPAVHSCFLQKVLVTRYDKVNSTQWERLRLFAVLEAVNNKGACSWGDFGEVINPLLAAQFGLTGIAEKAVGFVELMGGWLANHTKAVSSEDVQLDSELQVKKML